MKRVLMSIAAVVLVIGGMVVVDRVGATPSSGVTAETARGPLTEDLALRSHYDNGGWVHLQSKGPIEVITQRIVADPGATFGWHSHPGENVNVVLQGSLTLYHDDDCHHGTTYGPGSTFTTSPDQIHLARNLGSNQLILFATYYAPLTDPRQAVRIDQPLPEVGCPQ